MKTWCFGLLLTREQSHIQLSHYPPIRQVREELEGTATHLASTLSTPFHAAPPSRQLLVPSVKCTLPCVSMLMPKCEREADACRWLWKARECEATRENIADGCPSVFLSLSCFLCVYAVFFLKRIPSQNHSVWACQTHGIGLNYFLLFSDSVFSTSSQYSL